MPTTAGIAFFAASEKLATLGVLTGVEVSCSSTTCPRLLAEAGEEIRPQRRDDEQRGKAQRAGLREHEPETAQQRGLESGERVDYKQLRHRSDARGGPTPGPERAARGRPASGRTISSQPVDFQP